MRSRLGPAAVGSVAFVLALAACASGGGAPAGGAASAPVTSSPAAAALAGSTPGTTATAAIKFKVTLTAPGHTAKANVRWRYSIRVTNLAGKPIKATVTMQIVDPLRQSHPVQYDGTTKNITNWPFTGVFRDYIEFPTSARGLTLTVRATVNAKGGTRRLDYPVTVQ